MIFRLILAFLVLSTPALAADKLDKLITGPVRYVVDGDTFDIGETRIRLWGVNTPERGKQGYEAATDFLKQLVENATVNCMGMYYDRYERTVASCEVEGQDIGKMLVQAGVAIDYKRYSKGFYSSDEMQAKANKRGLWGHQ